MASAPESSEVIVNIEIGENGQRVLILKEVLAGARTKTSWNVQKKLTTDESGHRVRVQYLLSQVPDARVALTVDMTKRLEYNVYPSVLTIDEGEHSRTEMLLCGFFYQFP
ncbi:MAG: hypothetical protein AABZ55_11905 [Bdellovibrionota bacterium]